MLFHSFSKSKFKNDQFQICIEGRKIEQVNVTKFLGVLIDENLNWKRHIEYTANKIAKVVGIMIKARLYLCRKTLVNLYYTFAYPYFTYCNTLWSSTYPSNLKILERLQKKIIRIITFSHPQSHSLPLFNSLDIMPFPKINVYLTGIFMHKHKTNKLPIIFHNFFTINAEIHAHNTRQKHKYHINTVKCNRSKFSIKYHGPSVWNNIPEFLTDIPNSNLFKRKYKDFLQTT